MNKRISIRNAMLRLARMRELIAMQQMASEVVARNEAEAVALSEQEGYGALTQQYAGATASGGSIDLSRYEMLDVLRRAGETRLALAAQQVDESAAAVIRAGTMVHEASERKTTHRERLDKLEADVRHEAEKHEQHDAVETWLRMRTAP